MFLFFFFNDTATTEIYTLSLHDALPISCSRPRLLDLGRTLGLYFSVISAPSLGCWRKCAIPRDRKSTRLNSSHTVISYAVFCLKKKHIKSEVRHAASEQEAMA